MTGNEGKVTCTPPPPRNIFNYSIIQLHGQLKVKVCLPWKHSHHKAQLSAMLELLIVYHTIFNLQQIKYIRLSQILENAPFAEHLMVMTMRSPIILALHVGNWKMKRDSSFDVTLSSRAATKLTLCWLVQFSRVRELTFSPNSLRRHRWQILLQQNGNLNLWECLCHEQFLQHIVCETSWGWERFAQWGTCYSEDWNVYVHAQVMSL